jgi:hypothetical protein
MLNTTEVTLFIILFVLLAVSIFIVCRQKNVKDKNVNSPSPKAIPTPKAIPKKIKKEKNFGRRNIVGVGYKNLDGTNRQTLIKRCIRIIEGSFQSGHDIWFYAEREPSNKHDPNAIRIYAEEYWSTKRDESREKYIGTLGYLPRELAEEIRELTKTACSFVSVTVSNEKFEEFQNEKGKTLVGMSATISCSWEQEDQPF